MTFYVVHKGYNPGIYLTWLECKSQVNGFSGAIYCKTKTKSEAENFLKFGLLSKKKITNSCSETSLSKKKITNSCSETSLSKKQIKSENDETKLIEIYTDGSLIRKNGRCFGGYGIYIPSLGIEESYVQTAPKTNNRGELKAIIKSIEKFHDKNNELVIYTDSKYCILIATGTGLRYRKQNFLDNEGKLVKNHDLIEKLLNLLDVRKGINFMHIRAHTKKKDKHSLGNQKADELAVNGAKKDMSGSEIIFS